MNWLSFILLRFLNYHWLPSNRGKVNHNWLISCVRSIWWAPACVEFMWIIFTKPACNLYNPLSMTFLFFVVLFAKVAGSGQNRPNAGKSWDSCSGFYTTGSYKPPVNGIMSFEMKTLSVRERIEIKFLGRQRLFKRNSYQIRCNEYSKDNFFLYCVPRVDDCFLQAGASLAQLRWSNNRKCMTVISSYIFSVLLSS